jgi:hypothetical protein
VIYAWAVTRIWRRAAIELGDIAISGRKLSVRTKNIRLIIEMVNKIPYIASFLVLDHTLILPVMLLDQHQPRSGVAMSRPE